MNLKSSNLYKDLYIKWIQVEFWKPERNLNIENLTRINNVKNLKWISGSFLKTWNHAFHAGICSKINSCRTLKTWTKSENVEISQGLIVRKTWNGFQVCVLKIRSHGFYAGNWCCFSCRWCPWQTGAEFLLIFEQRRISCTARSHYHPLLPSRRCGGDQFKGLIESTNRTTRRD